MAAESPDAGEDALLEWIEAAQPVSSLCEISLAAQRGDESSPPASGGAAEPHAATGKALQAQVSRPSQLTYGELPLRQLKVALAKVREHGGLRGGNQQQQRGGSASGGGGGSAQFYDLGCGGGKLVLAAAALLQPTVAVAEAVGIELVGSLVAEAAALREELVAKLSSAQPAVGAGGADDQVTYTAADSESGVGVSTNGLAAAVAATRFVCGDVLDDAGNAAAGADWAAACIGDDTTSSLSCTTIVLVNGLCFPAKIKAAICERLRRRRAVALEGKEPRQPGRVFVLSTTPLPWLSDPPGGGGPPAAGDGTAAAGHAGGLSSDDLRGADYELVYTNEDDDDMDFIGMTLGDIDLSDKDELQGKQKEEDPAAAAAEDEEAGGADTGKGGGADGTMPPQSGGGGGAGGSGEDTGTGEIGSKFWDDFFLYLYRS
eukprot:COSAG06_NODE_2045_length_7751_cov_1.725039_8_plen_431_part_00